MIRSPARLRFLGDLSDPWVRDIAKVLPGAVERIDAPGPLDLARVPTMPAVACVLHRAVVAESDVEWLRRRAEARTERGRLVLIAGPHARYHQVQRCMPYVDALLPDATARESVRRALGFLPGRLAGRSDPVALFGSTNALLEVIAEALRDAGHPTRIADRPEIGASEASVVYEVPVLEPGWPQQLRRAARHRRLVALIGLADRELVFRARRAGAAACLDLPCDPADVLDALLGGVVEVAGVA